MKRSLLCFAFVFTLGTALFAGTFNQVKTIPGDYATINEAVAALNGGTVPDGGITFNVAAGHTESVTAPIILTATGRDGSPVVFIRSGAGANPLITRTDAGTVSVTTPGNHGDGVLVLNGSDYVVFDGIDIAATDQGIEYGYYLRKATATNACKNVTIRNATITLTKGTGRASAGICVANNSPTSSNISITTIDGIHENILLTGNTISNVFNGIFLKGHSTWPDRNIIVGTPGSGNTILNYGGAVAYESSGISFENIEDAVIANNSINNTAGGGSPFAGATGNGILNAGTGNNKVTITGNNISVTTQSTGFGHNLFGIRNRGNGEIFITGNTITLNTSVSTAINLYYISNEPASAGTRNVTINDNRFAASAFPSTGNIYLINNPNSHTAPSVSEIRGNATTGTIEKTESGGGFYLYSNTNNPTGTEIIAGNDFSGIVLTGATTFHGISSNTNVSHTHQVFDNTISNITGGTSAFTGIQLAASGTRTIYGNKIYNINTAGAITGIANNSGNSTAHIYGNDISRLTTSSTSGSGVLVSGITIAAGIQTYVYNNFISGLYSPGGRSTDALRGISLTTNTHNSFIGIYHNTIYLDNNTSGTPFGSSGIYHTASTSEANFVLDLRNNIIVNNSTQQGTGRTAALYRTSSYAANYTTTSDNNIFYAGTPGTYNLIYYCGSSYQTLEAFQAAVAPREASSHTELPQFVNITTHPYNLHLRTDVPTLAESTGKTVSSPVSIATDFDGDPRSATPDIGADEFNGISSFVANPAEFTAIPFSSQQNLLSFVRNAASNNVVLVFNTTGTFTDPAGAPAVGGALAGGTVLYYGASSPFIHSSLTAGTTYHYKAFSYNGSSYSRGIAASSAPGVIPVSGAVARAASQSINNLSWTPNSAGNQVIVSVHNVFPGGNPTNGTIYNPGDVITNGGTVIYRGPATGYNHTGLSTWTQYYYKLWSVDGYNQHSTGVVVNSVTYPEPVAYLPYLQTFDGAWSHSPAAPEGWEVKDYVATWARSSNASVSGSWSARGQVTSTSANAWLISPPLVLPDDNLQVSWWDKVSTATNTSRYKVLISTTGKDTSSFTTELGEFTCTNTDWVLRLIDLTAWKGQTVHLAFKLVYSALLYSYFNIDDVLVETKVPGASSLTYPLDGMTTFAEDQLLQWQAPVTSTPVTGYRVYLGTTANPTTMVYEGTETSFLAQSLVPGTRYYWKVVAYNANGSSQFVPVWSFAIVRQAQLAESFENEWSPPAGWMIDASSNWWISDNYQFHGKTSIHMYAGSTPRKLQTPLLAPVNGDKFELYAFTASSTWQRIQLFRSSDRNTWTPIGDEIVVVPQKWTALSVDLSSLAGGQYYFGIGIYYAAGGSGSYVYLDHVTGPDIVPVTPGPAREPNPVHGDSWFPLSKPLKWWPGSTGGVPAGYKIYIGTDGGGVSRPTNIANGTVVSKESWVPPTALAASTLYYWQIVPFNTAGDAAGCPIWSFTSGPAGGIQIGEDDEDYLDQPINPYYNYNYTQAIYLQSEINVSGLDLNRIYYQWSGGAGGEKCRDWVIYIGHTTKATFDSKTDWVPVAQMTKVFEGQVDLPVAAGWIGIDLDVPFAYNNTDNLVIAVHEFTPGYESGIYFLGTDTETSRAIVFYDDNLNPNPASPPTADFVHKGVANIRMHFGVDTRAGKVAGGNTEASKLLLWPNPASDIVYLQLNSDAGAVERVEVLDLAGRVLMAATGETIRTAAPGNASMIMVGDQARSTYMLEIGRLPKGTYIVRVSGKGVVATGRLIK